MDDAVGDELMPIDAIESTIVRNKEFEQTLKASSSNMVESHEMVTPCKGDHIDSPSHLYADSLDGNSLDRVHSSEHASASPRCANDAGIMVEELTLTNYIGENLAIVSTLSNRDRMQNKQNFYQMAGRSFSGSIAGESGPRDEGWATSAAWEDIGYTSFPGFLDPNKRPTADNEVVDPKQVGDGQSLKNDVSSSSGGARTKNLSKSGFFEYFTKNTFKGKGVICTGPKHQGSRGEFGKPSHLESSKVGVEYTDAPLTLAAETVAPLLDVAESSPSVHSNASHHEISLREWLKAGQSPVNKFESLRIFRQIVELVDSAHSQGVILQDLRLSCFRLSESNRVIYIGSSMRTELKEHIPNENVAHSDVNKKRKYERALTLVNSCIKKPKFDEGMNLARKWPQFPPRAGLRSAMNGITDTAGPEDSRNNSDEAHDAKSKCKANGRSRSSSPHVSDILQEQLASGSCMLEEKWYTSPEQFTERVCTFASNIYCLGVLLFELLGSFDSGRLHTAAMFDLRHRILPPGFLSEHPREAGFCLWLLHPVPSSRPITRDILQSEVISGPEEVSGNKLLSSIGEEDADSELLLNFLLSLKEQKEKDASKLVAEIGCVEADIKEVERRQPRKLPPLSPSNHEYPDTSKFGLGGFTSLDLHPRFPSSGDKETMLMRNIKQLENAYFSTRSNIELLDNNVMLRSDRELLKSREREDRINKGEEKLDLSDRHGSFFGGLCKYARYSKFEEKGLLRIAEFNNYANVICSLTFDRDEDYIATAGVSKKIKIFEFQSFLDDSFDIHYPAVEMPNKSKLTCICWNSYIRNYLASTDYGGVVKLWDVSTGEAFNQLAEHKERAWSVDFSRVDPTKLASGSDDRLVKVWSLNERHSLCTIKNNANVCCVQFSADSAHMLAYSSADYRTYCYDLRNASAPWCILAGHQKAVSYAKFLDAETLVTASTDNTLKIWDLNKSSSTGLSSNACILTLKGHTNEKNFVGLSVADGYIACGSETNEVFSYYRSLPMPITSHKFVSINSITGKETEDDNGHFISSVCWRRKSDMVVAASSSGSIKLLQMV